MSMGIALVERLDALVADAAVRLDAASGATAVCTWTRAGVAVPGIKYAEGRWAALRGLQRSVRRGNSVDAALDQERRLWTDALEALQARSGGGDWIAYRTGGVDALQELDG